MEESKHDSDNEKGENEIQGGPRDNVPGSGLGGEASTSSNDTAITLPSSNAVTANELTRRNYEDREDNRGSVEGEPEVQNDDQLFSLPIDVQPNIQLLTEIERLRLEDDRSFREGQQIGFDYPHQAALPAPDVRDALDESVEFPDRDIPDGAPDELAALIAGILQGRDDSDIQPPDSDAIAEINFLRQAGRGFDPGNIPPETPAVHNFVLNELRDTLHAPGPVFIPASVLDAYEEIVSTRRRANRRRAGREARGRERGGGRDEGRSLVPVEDAADQAHQSFDPDQEEEDQDLGRSQLRTIREVERLHFEDERGFRYRHVIDFAYRDPAEFPVPDMPVDGLHEFFEIADPEDPLPEENPDFNDEVHPLLGEPWSQRREGGETQAQVLQINRDPEERELEYRGEATESGEEQRPQRREGLSVRAQVLGLSDAGEEREFENTDSVQPWAQTREGEVTAQALQTGDDGEEWESEYADENAQPSPQRRGSEGSTAEFLQIQTDDEQERTLDPAELSYDLYTSDEAPERPYIDFDVEPTVHDDFPHNMSRDSDILWGPYIAEGVPAFRSFQDRENWIRQMLLRESANHRALWGTQVLAEGQIPVLIAEEQPVSDREPALDEEMIDETCTESVLSDPHHQASSDIPSPISPSAWEPDPPGELYPRRTFEPCSRPERPPEWTVSGRNHEREPGEDLQLLVMIGEIDPDFECFEGNVWIIHPGHIRRGRQFPTGFIHVVKSEEDFRRYGFLHGDLILKIGGFADVTASFEARPAARRLWVPLSGATLHSFVDLTTRTHVDPDRYETMPSKFIGWVYGYNRNENIAPLTVDRLAASSTVREQLVGTICTALFRPQQGDLLILPQAWEDNFDHQQNFRRSMLKWYKGPEISEQFLTDGTMVVRFCVDREFRSDGYRRMTQFDDPLRLLPLTYPTDADFNWGFAELFMWNGVDWFFWGRDRLRPTPHLSMGMDRCLYYCSNA